MATGHFSIQCYRCSDGGGAGGVTISINIIVIIISSLYSNRNVFLCIFHIFIHVFFYIFGSNLDKPFVLV